MTTIEKQNREQDRLIWIAFALCVVGFTAYGCGRDAGRDTFSGGSGIETLGSDTADDRL